MVLLSPTDKPGECLLSLGMRSSVSRKDQQSEANAVPRRPPRLPGKIVSKVPSITHVGREASIRRFPGTCNLALLTDHDTSKENRCFSIHVSDGLAALPCPFLFIC